jgi:hypothetical protein
MALAKNAFELDVTDFFLAISVFKWLDKLFSFLQVSKEVLGFDGFQLKRMENKTLMWTNSPRSCKNKDQIK